MGVAPDELSVCVRREVAERRAKSLMLPQQNLHVCIVGIQKTSCHV